MMNTGSSTPAAADRDKPWARTNANGSDDGIWTYYNGYWVQKHPDFVGKIVFAPIGTALADIPTLDGGESAATTDIAGPFWEVVTELNAKSIIGPGTLASGTVITHDTTLGEEEHVLSVPEMPAHTHQFATGDNPKSFAPTITDKEGDVNQTGSLDYKTLNTLQNTGGGEGHNTIHPVYALYAIKRTARLYRRRNA